MAGRHLGVLTRSHLWITLSLALAASGCESVDPETARTREKVMPGYVSPAPLQAKLQRERTDTFSVQRVGKRQRAASGFREGIYAYLPTKRSGCGSTRRSDFKSRRVDTESEAVLTAALDHLLAAAQGRRNDRAADLLNWVSVDNGIAVVDLKPFHDAFPWSNTGCGIGGFRSMLAHTIFQFPTVRAVLYQVNGSCEAFHRLQESACIPETRIYTRAQWKEAKAYGARTR